MKLLDVIREMNEAQARGYNLNKRLKELKNEIH